MRKQCGHERGYACGCKEEAWHDQQDHQPDTVTFMRSNHGNYQQRMRMRHRVELEEPE